MDLRACCESIGLSPGLGSILSKQGFLTVTGPPEDPKEGLLRVDCVVQGGISGLRMKALESSSELTKRGATAVVD